VRDLSIDKEKQIKLVFSGENTELDKKIIELIQDPIMHIIRNSVDHGIESPAARKKIGKLPEGIIILNAYQHGNRIVIEIEDDGAGIDKERVKEVARKKGLITDEEAQQLDDNAVFELLFQPEFSTRDEVSSVSGRGVGLNVVRDALNRLQGNIKIDSQQGVFTKFVLDLPITVAVSSILMFTLMGRLYSLPQSEIKETVKLDQPLGDEKTIKLKGEDIPVFTLGDFLDLPKYEHDTPPMLLITEYMNKKVALAVDTLEGEEHVIIKNMGSYLNKVKNIAGAAILSDTRLVLVLDLPEMLAASWKQFAVEK